ncbi:MAG: DUF6713 family protein [Clostridiaceae bacterium]
MSCLSVVLFYINISLLLVHEMDAIRCKEWRMFIFLKDMEEDTAYRIFTIVHIPLYILLILLILNEADKFSIILDFLLILHSIVHFLFRKNKKNGFNNLFSQVIIYAMGVISILHGVLNIQ